MAKNTNSSTFRRLDVDRLSNNSFIDDIANSVTTEQPDFDLSEIGDLLARNQPAEALIACLEKDPPSTLKTSDQKVRNCSFIILY